MCTSKERRQRRRVDEGRPWRSDATGRGRGGSVSTKRRRGSYREEKEEEMTLRSIDEDITAD